MYAHATDTIYTTCSVEHISLEAQVIEYVAERRWTSSTLAIVEKLRCLVSLMDRH